MYCEFFGFKEPPFAITPNARFIFLSKHHREAFAHLLYGIDSHAGFIELTGEVGSGKTTTLRALLSQLDDTKYRTALIFNSSLTAEELLRSINREFGIQTDGSVDELMHALNQLLLWENAFGRTVVLVIDEAQNLGPALLEQIRMISNLETDTEKLIQIVLAGQPELGKMLEGENLRQLSQRITVRFNLQPLDFEDMCSYIDHRLEIAGGWKAVSFAPAALKKIFDHSRGLPRLINVLCDRALLVAYTEESREISAKMVGQAIRELRRDTAHPTPARWPWRLLAASLIATLLAMAGFLAGQQWTHPQAQKLPAPTIATQKAVGTAIATQQLLIGSLGPQDEITSARLGFNELAKLWNVRPVVRFQGKTVQHGLERIAARRGLSLLTFSGSLQELLHSNTPSLLELRLPGVEGNRYLALTRLQAGELCVMPALKGRQALTTTELQAIWTGRAYIPWRNPHNLPDTSVTGKSSAGIRTLQLMLNEAGVFNGKPTGTFDLITKEAVKKFQASQNLPADGLPGPHTLFLLSRVSGTSREPRLINSTEARP